MKYEDKEMYLLMWKPSTGEWEKYTVEMTPDQPTHEVHIKMSHKVSGDVK